MHGLDDDACRTRMPTIDRLPGSRERAYNQLIPIQLLPSPRKAQTMTTQSMRFGHFGITCFDITAMEDFYTRVMGMVVADRGYVPPPADRHLVFMTLNPGEHHQFILCSGRTEGKIESGPFRGGGRGSAINQTTSSAASRACVASL
jgi:hypothetical protein